MSRGGIQEQCLTCPTGMVPDYAQKLRICAIGTRLERNNRCVSCPPGTNGYGFYGEELVFECFPCHAGNFADRAGTIRCSRCPLGNVSLVDGASSCEACPSGYMPSSNRLGPNACISTVTGCRSVEIPGPTFGRFWTRMCSPGTPEEDIGVKCVGCRPRSILSEGERKICPASAASDGGVQTKC